MQGEVLAVGPGARDEDGERIAMDVKAGDIVLFGKWSGTEVKLDGQDLLIMKEMRRHGRRRRQEGRGEEGGVRQEAVGSRSDCRV